MTASARRLRATSAWDDLAASWRIHLRARNVSEQTSATYLKSLRALEDWALPQGLIHPAALRRLDHERFLGEEAARVSRFGGPVSPATIHKHHRQLRVFYSWLVEVEEADANPYDKIPAPKVSTKVIPTVSDDDLRLLMAACKGSSFAARRDAAMIRVLFDTGLRRGELSSMTVERLHLGEGRALVTGKGDKERWVALSPKTVEALDAYLRARSKHRDRHLEELWLAALPHRGALGYDGVRSLLVRRCADAGIEVINPHRLRHTSINGALAAGIPEGDVIANSGWTAASGPQMISRYGASQRAARAAAAYKAAAPGDRI